MSHTVHDLAAAQEYRFVPEGPALAEAEWQAALALLEQAEAGWVVASGSLPPGVPEDFYARAAAIAAPPRPALRAGLPPARRCGRRSAPGWR